jgi:hypothetical protein
MDNYSKQENERIKNGFRVKPGMTAKSVASFAPLKLSNGD